MLGRLPVQLILALVVMTAITLYAMIKSLFVKLRIEDPGRVLSRDEAPGLWALTVEVANAIGTRPVDEIRITPGTEVAVYERGTRKEKATDTAERILILGTGVLNGFRVDAFRAVLGHEYGHFSNRDTAGGEIALRVNHDMMVMAHAIIASGQATHLNLAFQFLRVYHFLFRRISHGASRLQEVLADRVAAMQYGAEAFEEGLRHVIRRSTEFAFLMQRESQPALATNGTVSNLYDLSPEEASSVEEMVEKTLAGPTTDDDTHPCPNDRFKLVRDVISARSIPDDAMVWDLFADRDAITGEMTSLIRSFAPTPIVIPEQSQEGSETAVEIKAPPEKKGLFHRCAQCETRIAWGGFTENGFRYCSMACFTFGSYPGFCPSCEASTTEEPAGSTTTYNGVGTSLRASGPRCRTCHSLPTKKWIVVLLIPLIPLKEYRIRWINQQSYVGRRVRK
jgi:Zn-dependent protease with chaperone function